MNRHTNNKLSDTLIYNLETTARISRALACRQFEECKEVEVTFNEYVIIDALYSNPGVHQRDLAKIICKGTANLSRDLEKLEEKGLIERIINSKGKRIVKTLKLTNLGKKVHNQTEFFIRKSIARVENIFSEEEYTQFQTLIAKLRDKLTESSDMFFE